MDIKKLCRACDEARIRWGESANRRGLQLSRWGCTRWFLYSAVCEHGLKHRPVVREVADCVLEMQEAWQAIGKDCGMILHSFSAGLVVGPLFASFEGGKFLSGLSGRAFDTACGLAAEATTYDVAGCVMVTDTVVEALRHTHDVRLQGTNYRLFSALVMPYNHDVSSLIGSAVDWDPVSPGASTALAGSATISPGALTFGQRHGGGGRASSQWRKESSHHRPTHADGRQQQQCADVVPDWLRPQVDRHARRVWQAGAAGAECDHAAKPRP
eukprot:scaffold90803_cov42-Prasinocladus_malaysianus.AAC.1